MKHNNNCKHNESIIFKIFMLFNKEFDLVSTTHYHIISNTLTNYSIRQFNLSGLLYVSGIKPKHAITSNMETIFQQLILLYCKDCIKQFLLKNNLYDKFNKNVLIEYVNQYFIKKYNLSELYDDTFDMYFKIMLFRQLSVSQTITSAFVWDTDPSVEWLMINYDFLRMIDAYLFNK